MVRRKEWEGSNGSSRGAGSGGDDKGCVDEDGSCKVEDEGGVGAGNVGGFGVVLVKTRGWLGAADVGNNASLVLLSLVRIMICPTSTNVYLTESCISQTCVVRHSHPPRSPYRYPGFLVHFRFSRGKGNLSSCVAGSLNPLYQILISTVWPSSNDRVSTDALSLTRSHDLSIRRCQ